MMVNTSIKDLISNPTFDFETLEIFTSCAIIISVKNLIAIGAQRLVVPSKMACRAFTFLGDFNSFSFQVRAEN